MLQRLLLLSLSIMDAFCCIFIHLCPTHWRHEAHKWSNASHVTYRKTSICSKSVEINIFMRQVIVTKLEDTHLHI